MADVKLAFTTWAKMKMAKDLGSSDLQVLMSKTGDELYDTIFKLAQILTEAYIRRNHLEEPVPPLDDFYDLTEKEVVELTDAILQSYKEAHGITVEIIPEKKEKATQ